LAITYSQPAPASTGRWLFLPPAAFAPPPVPHEQADPTHRVGQIGSPVRILIS
jgi:hypothetical protein